MSDAPIANPSTIRYSSYTAAQKRATQKYRANNKDKVNEQRKAYYEARKEADPEFLAYKREKAKEYYQRKKASLPASIPDAEQLLPEDMNSAYTGPMDEEPQTPMPESVIESIPAIVESPLDSGIEIIPDVPVDTPSAKVKKPRAPRKKVVDMSDDDEPVERAIIDKIKSNSKSLELEVSDDDEPVVRATIETPSAKVKKPRAPRKKAIVADVVASIELPIQSSDETIPVPIDVVPSKPKGKVKFYPPKVIDEVKE